MKTTILYVEDDIKQGLLVQALLQSDLLDVFVARNISQAVDFFVSYQAISLIILDYHLDYCESNDATAIDLLDALYEMPSIILSNYRRILYSQRHRYNVAMQKTLLKYGVSDSDMFLLQKDWIIEPLKLLVVDCLVDSI